MDELPSAADLDAYRLLVRLGAADEAALVEALPGGAASALLDSLRAKGPASTGPVFRPLAPARRRCRAPAR